MHTSIRSTTKVAWRLTLVLSTLLLSLTLLTSCESKRIIVNGIDEKEANEIVVFLSKRGVIAYKSQAKETGGGGAKVVLWDISVSAEESTEAMSILNQAGLPRRRGQSLLGLFSDVGLVPSELQDRIRYQAGLAAQIATTIRKIDGVLDAEVQISFPEEDPLNPTAEKQNIVASVYVKHSGVLDDPNTHLTTKIKRLVTSSITGLNYDNVTIISDRARYAELPDTFLQGYLDEDKPLVNVWTLVIAQESASRFRMIFFSFIIVILLYTASLIWAGWKLYPLLKRHGGIKQLFNVHPIPLEPQEEVEEEEEEGEEEEGEKEEAPAAKEAKGEEEEEGLMERDIDET